MTSTAKMVLRDGMFILSVVVIVLVGLGWLAWLVGGRLGVGLAELEARKRLASWQKFDKKDQERLSTVSSRITKGDLAVTYRDGPEAYEPLEIIESGNRSLVPGLNKCWMYRGVTLTVIETGSQIDNIDLLLVDYKPPNGATGGCRNKVFMPRSEFARIKMQQ